jgi:acetyltransferase-like isoleucine patch superfamily enzyme
MTTQRYEANITTPPDVEALYIRPDRYESKLQRLLTNATPLIAGFLRLQGNPLRKGSFGKLTRIKGRVRLKVSGTISVGDRVAFWGNPLPVSVHVAKGATLRVGDRVFMNYGVDIGCYHRVTIGNDVLIGPLTNVLDDPLHELQPGDVARPAPIVIEDNVWIARNCVIQPGVTIGRNSVIASGSVVTKDIPPNSLAAGVPAKVLRELTIPDGWRRR